MNEINLELHGAEETIKLGDALKVSGVVGTGGQAKIVIQNGEVKVDGVVATQRGMKISRGQTIEYENNLIKVM